MQHHQLNLFNPPLLYDPEIGETVRSIHGLMPGVIGKVVSKNLRGTIVFQPEGTDSEIYLIANQYEGLCQNF
ncbi:MAG: hypothetical protein VKL42_12455 [Snowella sp.]|nr:hypothetical protein [Snowella sp.]